MKIKLTTIHRYLCSFILSFTLLLLANGVSAQVTDCVSGCTSTVTSTTGTVTVNPGQTVCLVPAGAFTGTIVINGGTLKTCGTVTPSTVNYNNGSNPATIYNNGNIALPNTNWNANVFVQNNPGGFLRINGSANLNGWLANQGLAVVVGDLNVNSTGFLTNSATLLVIGNMINTNFVYNTNTSATINVGGNLTNNSPGLLDNEGLLQVRTDLSNNGILINGSNIQVGNQTTLNGGSTLYMLSGSQLTTTDLTVNSRIIGPAATSPCASIRVSNRTIINSGANISGRVDICDANGIETNNGTVVPPASTNCSCTVVLFDAFRTSPLSAPDDMPAEAGINAYPSPFSNSLSIHYTLKENTSVTLSLYNLAGLKIKDVVTNETQNAGDHTVEVNTSDLTSGIYIYMLNAGKEVKSGKVVKK